MLQRMFMIKEWDSYININYRFDLSLLKHYKWSADHKKMAVNYICCSIKKIIENGVLVALLLF